MRVFLSWSGDRSRMIAESLRDWLPNVIQAIQPWMSSFDVRVGTRWTSEVAFALQETRFGIVCLTPENVNAPWILFEAGALSKSLSDALVCPYLFDFQPCDLQGPLAQFQAVRADREGTWGLIQTLNRMLLEQALTEARLARAFDIFWPELADRLAAHSAMRHVVVSGNHDVSTETTPHDRLLEDLLRKLASPSSGESAAEQSADYVFIAHGRNRGQREAVARVIERLGPKVVILEQQPNEGMTVIEKLQRYADVSYAVVIMTPDDVGSLAGISGSLTPRARQNVILELGYLLAKLGRSRVCVLYEPPLEIPSDLSGVLYITLDESGAWQFILARELKTAGLHVDVNKLL